MLLRWVLWVLMFHFVVLGVAWGEKASPAVSFSSSSLLTQPMRSTPVRIERAQPHALDISLYTSIAAYRTLDFLRTRQVLAEGGREAELPQWVVNTPATFLAFEGLATATEVGSSIWLIHHGHRRVARAMNIISVGLGAETVAHNYRMAMAGQP